MSGKDSQEGKETGREIRKEHESQGGPLVHYWLGFRSSTSTQKGETNLYQQKSHGFKIILFHTHAQ